MATVIHTKKSNALEQLLQGAAQAIPLGLQISEARWRKQRDQKVMALREALQTAQTGLANYQLETARKLRPSQIEEAGLAPAATRAGTELKTQQAAEAKARAEAAGKIDPYHQALIAAEAQRTKGAQAGAILDLMTETQPLYKGEGPERAPIELGTPGAWQDIMEMGRGREPIPEAGDAWKRLRNEEAQAMLNRYSKMSPADVELEVSGLSYQVIAQLSLPLLENIKMAGRAMAMAKTPEEKELAQATAETFQSMLRTMLLTADRRMKAGAGAPTVPGAGVDLSPRTEEDIRRELMGGGLE